MTLTAERMRSKTSLKRLVRGAVQSIRLRKGAMKKRLWLECRQKRGQDRRPSVAWLNKKQSRKAEVKGELEKLQKST